MTVLSDLEIFKWVAGIILAANALAMMLFVLFAKLPDGRLREQIRGSIFVLDNFADCMENEEKRVKAIQQVNDVLGWRRILIPSAIIGWIIDAEVAAIRKMQMTVDIPTLHTRESDADEKGDFGGSQSTRFSGEE